MPLIFSKYGISPLGFAMPASKNELFEEYKTSILQTVPQIDLRTGSIFNLFLNANNNVLFNLLEQFESFYYSKDPSSAVGIEQDSLYAINDLERIPAASSFVSIICNGENSTVIKKNTQISNSATGDIFINDKDEVISPTSCVKIALTLTNIANNTPYNLSINGFYCGVISGTIATTNNILDTVVDAIVSEVQNINCNAVNNNGVLEITSNNLLQPFSIAISSSFKIGKISSPFTFKSIQTGEVLVNANTITQINTITTGLDSVYNPSDGQFGRNVETDQEYRERQARIGVYNRAKSTYNAILNAFNDPEQIQGISYVDLQINDTDTTNIDGVPARSIHLIIEGGADEDIANLLWTTKAGGIKPTHGNTSVSIKDIDGNIRVIKFSRPVKRYIWIQGISATGGDYSLPSDYVTQIKNWILIYGNKLKIGDNVMLKVAAGFALSNIQGLDDLELEATTTETENGMPTNYSAGNIAISSNEVAIFSFDRISIA